MKKIPAKLLLSTGLLLVTLFAKGQGLAVNANGAAADSSAILDVSSAKKGVLIPRMLSSQRTGIVNPATGLLVYQTDAPAGFYQYNGSAWLSLLSDSVAAGGDLAGKYPNPSIATTSAAGSNIVSAINASTGVVNPANLGTGTANSSTYLRGDGTWASPAAKFVIPMGGGASEIGMTTTSTGATDSVGFIGLGAAGNQWINVNGGSYIDPSNTFPSVTVPVPVSGTITSLSFFLHCAPDMGTAFLFSGTYTLTAQLYYTAPPLSSLIAGEQFYPVPGATVSINMNNVSGGVLIQGETITANVTGLSYPITAGSRLVLMVYYSVNTTPFQLFNLRSYVTAAVGMQ
ncbi:MAG TPA: hypothetical protein VG738_22475 [Chitinophagaceae bacterium]|nr:hypothetical protein [Chitinophagaceae bacterium]